jgi:hypothetical protein
MLGNYRIHCKACDKLFDIRANFIHEKHVSCPVCTHPIIVEQHGGYCWKYESEDYDFKDPCSGHMHVTEDYPGMYTYFCDKHGHPDDG